MVPLSHYLTLGAIIFFIGVWGVLTRRNAVIILLSIELMFNAVNITVIHYTVPESPLPMSFNRVVY